MNQIRQPPGWPRPAAAGSKCACACTRIIARSLDQRRREVTCELWDREDLDEAGITAWRP